MSTVKISELPEITSLNANTEQSLAVGVDIVTGVTGKYTLKTLAQGLYSNDVLNVGNNAVVFPNVIAQFVSSADPYLQINMQNLDGNGSTDMVLTADTGTDAEGFIDLGINGSTFDQPEYTSMGSLDGYLFAVGPSAESHKGNLVIGTATTDSNVVFAVGGTLKENVVARMTNTGFTLNGASFFTFADSSTQSVAAAPANLTQSAYNRANTASANTVIIQGVDLSQNASISQVNTFAASAYNKANTNSDTIAIIESVNLTQNTNITAVNTFSGSAYNKANNALANTSGTFAGDLTITGNVFASSISTSNLISFFGSTTPANRALVELIGSTSGSLQTPSNDGYMLHVTGKDDVPTRVVFDAFGANSYPLIAGRKGRGVAGTPSAAANNDILMRISSNGWGTTGFAPFGSGRIDFVATENYTDSTRGSKIVFYNVQNGTNTINQIAEFNANTVQFTGTVNPTKGFIFTPKVLPGAQTAITIDFSNDSTIKASCNDDVTISLTNYTYGKIVEVWLTNTGGQNRTVTHGCTALNSTNKATTFTITASSSAYMRYFSIDGDNANTFVTISA